MNQLMGASCRTKGQLIVLLLLLIFIVLFIVHNGNILTDGANGRKYLRRKHKDFLLLIYNTVLFYSLDSVPV